MSKIGVTVVESLAVASPLPIMSVCVIVVLGTQATFEDDIRIAFLQMNGCTAPVSPHIVVPSGLRAALGCALLSCMQAHDE
jgi:hypothetical protein